MVTNEQEELKPCPFCGAGSAMLYRVDGRDFYGSKRPEIFCDACKASVYFEDSTSIGADDEEDYKVQVHTLVQGWDTRPDVKTQLQLARIEATIGAMKATQYSEPAETDARIAALEAQKAHLTTKGGDHE